EGLEGLKHVLRMAARSAKEVLITGIDDARYAKALPLFMKQHFRDLKARNVKERVLTARKAYRFSTLVAKTTAYRFLEQSQLNPVNTLVFGRWVAIVSWEEPVTVVAIESAGLAETYRGHFEQLWKVAARS
ncbi:MAG TPA: hypothetical protein VJB16_04225, partial [archaeon]|nr:hypothetical protein [archaeon]